MKTKNAPATLCALRRDFIRCWVHANPAFTEEKAHKLYDLLQEKFPEMSRPSHRGAKGRLAPWETIEHKCPNNCGCVVTGAQNIVDAFGLRNVKLAHGRKLYFQSWCPGCKNSKKKSKDDPTYGVRVNAGNIEVAFTN